MDELGHSQKKGRLHLVDLAANLVCLYTIGRLVDECLEAGMSRVEVLLKTKSDCHHKIGHSIKTSSLVSSLASQVFVVVARCF